MISPPFIRKGRRRKGERERETSSGGERGEGGNMGGGGGREVRSIQGIMKILAPTVFMCQPADQ